jgi:hypothetical protein
MANIQAGLTIFKPKVKQKDEILDHCISIDCKVELTWSAFLLSTREVPVQNSA